MKNVNKFKVIALLRVRAWVKVMIMVRMSAMTITRKKVKVHVGCFSR